MSEQNYWTRMQSRRISRRALMGASAKASVGAAGLVLVGCGDDDDDDAAGAAVDADEAQADQADQAQDQGDEQAVAVPAGRVGEILVGDPSGSFPQLDPITGSGGNDHQHLWVGHDNLVGYDSELTPDPDRSLAQSWEVSDDGLTIIFNLRPNVRFHDGEPLNAEAVSIHMLRARDLELGNTRADVQFIDSIETPEDLVVTFKMSQPFAPLLRILGDRSGMVVSPKAIAESDDFLNRTPVGTGAFKFVEEVADDKLVFEANDDYWQPGHPKINGVTWRLGVNPEQAVNGLLAGTFNSAFSLDPASIPTLEEGGLIVETRPSNWTSRYWLNMRMEPWDNAHLRRAVNWAVDKQRLVDVVYDGLHTPAHWGWLGPATGVDHDPDFEGYVYNPEKVREELALGGAPDGFEFDMNTFATAIDIAKDEFIQSNLAEFGIKANLNAKPSPAFWREFWDLEVSGHSSSMSVRADVWQQLAFVHDPLGQSVNVVPEDENDPDRVAVSGLLSDVAAAFDPDVRFEKIQELNRALDDAAWGLNFFHNAATTAHAPNVSYPLFSDAKPHWGQGDVTITA
jgi:ABC-type transport system substrate-binding protein